MVHRRTMRLPDRGPIVSFTFDDFPRSAYTTGGAMLKDRQVAGTFYTAFALMNSSNEAGVHFCMDDLYSVVADGHELASHTLHHVSSQVVPTPEFVEEVRRGRAAMQAVPGLVVSNNFAYPFGAVSVAAKRAVGKAMRSCRSSFHGVNGRGVDLNLLRANPLYGGTERMSLVRRLIRENEERSGWLIFYTHDVQNRPSPYGCTPALLEAALKAAIDAGMRILRVRDVVGDDQEGRAAVTPGC